MGVWATTGGGGPFPSGSETRGGFVRPGGVGGVVAAALDARPGAAGAEGAPGELFEVRAGSVRSASATRAKRPLPRRMGVVSVPGSFGLKESMDDASIANIGRECIPHPKSISTPQGGVLTNWQPISQPFLTTRQFLTSISIAGT